MAEGKKSFVLYVDQRGIFNKLSDEQAGILIKHIFSYVSDENPEGDFVTELAFESIKSQLKRDLNKWEETLSSKSQGGMIGNLKRWHPDLYKKYKANKLTLDESLSIASNRTTSDTDKNNRIASHSIAKIAVNDNVTVNVNDNVTVNDNVKKEKENIDIPTLKEFYAYAITLNEKVSQTDVKLKYNAWVENDWRDGYNKKIVRWKSKLAHSIKYMNVNK